MAEISHSHSPKCLNSEHVSQHIYQPLPVSIKYCAHYAMSDLLSSNAAGSGLGGVRGTTETETDQ